MAGKKAIVTGGARLCNGMAQALHDARAEVVLLDILDMVGDSAGRWQKRSHGTCGKGDLTKTEELENIYNECLEKLGGRVDILLNGAGIQLGLRLLIFPMTAGRKLLPLIECGILYVAAGRQNNAGAKIW
ncbi:MAG: SDR family NAD(P)-dependent oxidoreductase [Dialister invisus]